MNEEKLHYYFIIQKEPITKTMVAVKEHKSAIVELFDIDVKKDLVIRKEMLNIYQPL